VIEFIVAGVQTTSVRRGNAVGWFDRLIGFRASEVPFQGFALFVQLAGALILQIGDPAASPWLVWLVFMQRSGARDFTQRTRNTFNVLADLFGVVRGKSEESQAAATYALARVCRSFTDEDRIGVSLAVAAMLDMAALREAISTVRGNRSSRYLVRRKDDFMLWSFLRSADIDASLDLTLVLDIRTLLNDAQSALRMGFVDDGDDPSPIIRIPVQLLYQAMARLKVPDRDIHAIRPYFTEPATRKSITPLEVEIKGGMVAAAATTLPEQLAQREILTVDKGSNRRSPGKRTT
jgi:hypothetical protein